ncbi:phage tail completion protein [Trabulsiella guamensis ATCC 49490]|uniref:Phage tail completion protein n=1 Tax=Trabulsiella guamensis ATCC 49490 TaxID=1005994 RepID=A0A084ZPS7_9ENTR|nr:phage virion morphogenesis protein [Trabulsiella guamensis]KFB99471.1 phage tail completion protein [Trabulsiella guamensis ATCC 49490]
MTDALFRELDQAFSDIVNTLSYGGRHRLGRAIGSALRRSQQKRIRAQKNPDGSSFQPRRRRVTRTQQGIRFIWNDDVRHLKNWKHEIGRYGRRITGYDEDRGDMRTFYRSDIERYLEINTRAVTRPTRRQMKMFQRLATFRFLKMHGDASGAIVGYDGMAARIARIHQLGLKDEAAPGIFVEYPVRELLGVSESDERMVEGIIISEMSKARRYGRAYRGY